jgi:hypothetical protein
MGFKEDFESGIQPSVDALLAAHPTLSYLTLADWSNAMLYTSRYGPCFCEWSVHPGNDAGVWAAAAGSGLLDAVETFINTYTDKEDLAYQLAICYGKTDPEKYSRIVIDNTGPSWVVKEEGI